MNEPCIDCLCLPACKGQHLVDLVRKCQLFEDYIEMIECNVPRQSYRYLQVHALESTYEVKRKGDGCWWTLRRMYYNGREFNAGIDHNPIYINN